MHLHHLLVILVALDGPPRDTVPLYTDLGDHHVPITTPVSLAQQYFDQGLRLLYGFNHGEAIRSFNHAAQLDSNCAMCYWGVAYAYGPHVNAGMDSAAGLAAYQALQQALARERAASPRERAYIDALAKRYAPIPPADRAALDAAYAAAMSEVVKRYPNDLDAATLYAEALMDKRPWNYWDKDRKSTRLNSSHSQISYAVFCLKKKIQPPEITRAQQSPTHRPGSRPAKDGPNFARLLPDGPNGRSRPRQRLIVPPWHCGRKVTT